ncbi:VQ motif-containing protein [Euphorbia peplus]|nr:VQ motif-containing protein [Euphorbia peplus]
MKNCLCKPNSSSPPSNLSLRKLSHTTTNNMISKLKPKVRIIHIFAPEIIKTDVANFRELVQRLTGKPDHDHDHQQFNNKKMMKKNKKKKSSPENLVQLHDEQEEKLVVLERDNYEMSSWGRSNIDDQEYGENNNHGFLDVFDEFMQTNSDLGDHVYAPLNLLN